MNQNNNAEGGGTTGQPQLMVATITVEAFALAGESNRHAEQRIEQALVSAIAEANVEFSKTAIVCEIRPC